MPFPTHIVATGGFVEDGQGNILLVKTRDGGWVYPGVGRQYAAVEGQEHSPIESRYFSGFFVLSVQVLVPNQRQELVPIAVKDKNIIRLPIR
ncbi:hypothetical protein [Paenibacillus cellulositrophicus]|uniref:hypothetical protein n=1 Tax=Paenibacillus cellulositrophicus TaxID=562959 RepID=UPI001FCB6CBA|nr:hypothetical protein [Paenibacillus cellulositrophicus]